MFDFSLLQKIKRLSNVRKASSNLDFSSNVSFYCLIIFKEDFVSLKKSLVSVSFFQGVLTISG